MLALLCGTACLAQAEGGAAEISFAAKRVTVNGGFEACLQINVSPSPNQADMEIRVKDESGKEYTVSLAAGQKQASLILPTQEVSAAKTIAFSLQPGAGVKIGKTAQCTLRVLPLPHISFYRRINIGYVGKKMSVTVSCGNSGTILDSNNVFELRDQTGRTLAKSKWKNPGADMRFSFDATKELEGGHDLSVWLGDYCVSSTEFGAITDSSRKLIQKINTTEPYMAITIDCNWYNSHAIEILDVLDKYDVKCTFFMTGNYLRLFPETAKEILARGHEIGNHSNTHMRQTAIGEYTQMKEILKPLEVAEKVLGVRPRLFRPPYGSYNKLTTAIARGAGMEVCMWTIDSHDWDVKLQHSREKVVKRAKKNVQPGAIVLFHLDGYGTAQTLDEVIPYYQNELGLKCVPVTQLMALEGLAPPPLPEGTSQLVIEGGDEIDLSAAPSNPG